MSQNCDESLPTYTLNVCIHGIHSIRGKCAKFLKNISGKVFVAVTADADALSPCVGARSAEDHEICIGRSISLTLHDDMSQIYFKVFGKTTNGEMKTIAAGCVTMRDVFKEECGWHIPLLYHGKSVCLLRTTISAHLHHSKKSTKPAYYAPVDGSVINEFAEGLLSLTSPVKEVIRQTSVDLFMLPVAMLSLLFQQARVTMPPSTPRIGMTLILDVTNPPLINL